MANGLPDHPNNIPAEDFDESFDDQTCPNCGWDRDKEAEDPMASYHRGICLAIEHAQGSPYSAMAGTQLAAFYWRCPDCQTFFTTEEEITLGAMS